MLRERLPTPSPPLPSRPNRRYGYRYGYLRSALADRTGSSHERQSSWSGGLLAAPPSSTAYGQFGVRPARRSTDCKLGAEGGDNGGWNKLEQGFVVCQRRDLFEQRG